MAKKKEYWTDADGDQVPVDYIDQRIRKRTVLVQSIVGKAQELSASMSDVKEWLARQVTDYLDTLAGEFGENWQGNTTLYDFGQTMSVEISIAKSITFDERFNIAKEKIDHCIDSWAEGAREEIRTLVNKVFQTDQKGRLNVKMILSLRQYKFEHPEWKEAMQIIADAIMIQGRKSYYNIKVKAADGTWQPVVLNFSAL